MQIVDNLHPERSNRNVLKPATRPTARARVPGAAVRKRAAVSPIARPRPNGDGAHTIRLLQSNSLPMLVQRELERMILAGDLPAGAKLNEATIADLLGVSRGPVREAFRALEESGLVRLEKNRGVFVRQIDVKEADEIYELRAVLDEFVGRRVSQTAKDPDIRELRSLVERMDKAAVRNDPDAGHQHVAPAGEDDADQPERPGDPAGEHGNACDRRRAGDEGRRQRGEDLPVGLAELPVEDRDDRHERGNRGDGRRAQQEDPAEGHLRPSPAPSSAPCGGAA